MPDEGLTIKVEGLDKLIAKFDQFPKVIQRNMSAAGRQAGKDIIETKGLQNYPPQTAANMPPTPYYIRGRGTQYQSRNAGNSEAMGTQWRIKTQNFQTTVGLGRRVSYAEWVHGEKQALSMARIGWKKLVDTAKGMIGRITKVYQAWVDKTIRDLKL